MSFLVSKLVHVSFNILVVVAATNNFLYVRTKDDGLQVGLAITPSEQGLYDKDIHVHIEQCKSP